VPITQLCDSAAIQIDASGPVIKQDKIIPSAIHFREAQHCTSFSTRPATTRAHSRSDGFPSRRSLLSKPLRDHVSVFTYPP